MTQFRKTYEKTVTLGHKLDLVFHQIRLGFFFLDYDLIGRNLDKAKTYALQILAYFVFIMVVNWNILLNFEKF